MNPTHVDDKIKMLDLYKQDNDNIMGLLERKILTEEEARRALLRIIVLISELRD